MASPVTGSTRNCCQWPGGPGAGDTPGPAPASKKCVISSAEENLCVSRQRPGRIEETEDDGVGFDEWVWVFGPGKLEVGCGHGEGAGTGTREHVCTDGFDGICGLA